MVTEETAPWNGSKAAWWKRTSPIWIPVLTAIAGGIMGGPAYRALDDPRRDPVTGRDMEAMEARVVSQLEGGDYRLRLADDRLEKSIDGVKRQITSLYATVVLLPPDKLVERVTRAEERIKHLDESCIKVDRSKRGATQ